MKQTIFLILFSMFLSSCKNDESISPELTGTWYLTEVLADPGDGSGIFMPVDSNKTITFLSSGIVESNESLCQGTIIQGTGLGTYSLQDSTIVPSCPDQEITVNILFKIEGANLILTYQCIEACAEKYVKR